MPTDQRTAAEIAASLLQINAIKLNVERPFTWASGLRSPIYCDNRLSLSYPWLRESIASGLSSLTGLHYPGVEVIAGVATGAIAHGLLVAHQLGLPFVYVRSKPKSHGMGSQIEGLIMEGRKVVVVEDLVSTAKSSIAACRALEAAGFELLGMAAIFSYELEVARKKLEEAGYPFVSLSNVHVLLEVALSQGIISGRELAILREWHQDPSAWSEAVD